MAQHVNSEVELIRLNEVCRMTVLSRSTIYRLMDKEDFPDNIDMSANVVAWIKSEVSDWIAVRIAKSREAKKKKK